VTTADGVEVAVGLEVATWDGAEGRVEYVMAEGYVGVRQAKPDRVGIYEPWQLVAESDERPAIWDDPPRGRGA
jgi:hypothetical protein